MRWINPDDPNVLVAPVHTVVPLADVRDYLPADHPVVTPAERNAEIETRTRAVNRRHNPAGIATFKDADGDDEHDTTDVCPDTADGEVVDQAGCSQEQFCNSIDTSSFAGILSCILADFQNDEPLVRRTRECGLEYSYGSYSCHED